MTKKKRARVEYLIRSIEVRSVYTHLSLHVDGERTGHPKPGGNCWMEVRGVFDEPVKGQSEVVISIQEDERGEIGPARPASIGHVIQMRPHLRAVVAMPPKAFERTWTLAASGRLSHAWISMTKPHYNDASVPSVAFANELIE